VKPRYLRHDGKPLFLIGVNHWGRSGGPLMWRRSRPDEVGRELAQMRELAAGEELRLALGEGAIRCPITPVWYGSIAA